MQATRGKLVTEQGDIVDRKRACSALPDAAATPLPPTDACLNQLVPAVLDAAGTVVNCEIL